MSGTPAIARVPAAETRALRRAILRPNQTPEACIYPGDNDPASFHLGIRDPDSPGDDLIAVASFYREPVPGDANNPAHAGTPDLRIRGMAVLPEHRGRGLGRTLAEAGLAIAREQTPPPALAWCNARTSACAYYEKLGFTPRGGEFEIEGIGPHFVMVRAVLLDTAE